VHAFDVLDVPGGDHNAIVMDVVPAGSGELGSESADGETGGRASS